MRKNIFGIYSALRHFGVSPEEVDGIARAYKTWFVNQPVGIPPYGMVYRQNNRLYSLPYKDARLDKLFVGIEIEGTVYFAHYLENVRHDELASRIQELASLITQDFSAAGSFSFNLRMPTQKEVKVLLEKTRNIDEVSSWVCNKPCPVWITPDDEHPKNTFVSINERNNVRGHRVSEQTRAALYLVAKPVEEDLFIGKTDHFGMPTRETNAMKTLLLSI